MEEAAASGQRGAAVEDPTRQSGEILQNIVFLKLWKRPYNLVEGSVKEWRDGRAHRSISDIQKCKEFVLQK